MFNAYFFSKIYGNLVVMSRKYLLDLYLDKTLGQNIIVVNYIAFDTIKNYPYCGLAPNPELLTPN